MSELYPRPGEPAEHERVAHGVRAKVERLARKAWNSEPVQTLVDQVRLLMQMVTDSDFDVALKVKIAVFGALAYFLLTSDAIPDIIPGLGLLDDAAVVGLVYAQVKKELDRYIAWRAERADDIVVQARIEPHTAD